MYPTRISNTFVLINNILTTISKNGPSGRTRTDNLQIKSLPLYHWVTKGLNFPRIIIYLSDNKWWSSDSLNQFHLSLNLQIEWISLDLSISQSNGQFSIGRMHSSKVRMRIAPLLFTAMLFERGKIILLFGFLILQSWASFSFANSSMQIACAFRQSEHIFSQAHFGDSQENSSIHSEHSCLCIFLSKNLTSNHLGETYH